MPGSGKSTIGRLLAEKIGFSFVDLDNLIRDREGKTHTQIILEKGDKELVRLEEFYTATLNLEKTVFAPGGSIVYSPAAMEKLRQETVAIYLSTPIDVIRKNLGDQIEQRGIVGLRGRGLEGVFAERSPLYEKYAHFTVDCGSKSAEEVCDAVAGLIV
ncbi:MAG: shikimate kinase [bacterium]|nr:shikimate kinase [bacterium]